MRLQLDGSVTSSAQNRAPANATIFSEATQRTPRDRDPNQEPAEATAVVHTNNNGDRRTSFFGTKYLGGDVRIVSHGTQLAMAGAAKDRTALQN